jgi:hypothetical protein
MMDYNSRNQSVAIARWNKKLNHEKDKLDYSEEYNLKRATLCGFLSGDGCVTARREGRNTHYEIRFFPDDKLMLDTYCKLLKEVYGKTPSIRIKGKMYYVRITSKTIYHDLTTFANFGIHNWTIPTKLLQIEGAKEAWIKAFFAAEAYVGKNVIKVQTVNSRAMNQLSQMLMQLGIENHYYEYPSKKGHHSSVSIIMITKKEARSKYYSRIGFWHSRKEQSLKKTLNL